jgi:hypothetical protein
MLRQPLQVLAIAQMGVHLVFILHITTGPDNTNNVLALAFGVLIVFLVVVGSGLDHGQSERRHDAVARADEHVICGTEPIYSARAMIREHVGCTRALRRLDSAGA